MALLYNYSMIVAIIYIMSMINDFPEANEEYKSDADLTNMAAFQYVGFEFGNEYELLYSKFDGLEEPIRHVLKRLYLHNYLHHPHKEIHFEKIEWLKNNLEIPYLHGPALIINGQIKLTQPSAICRYLAQYALLNGDNQWEAYLIDSHVDTINDLRREFVKCINEKNDKTASKLKKNFIENRLPYYMQRFENTVKYNQQHFVYGKFTWADTFFIGIIDAIDATMNINALVGYTNLIQLKGYVSSSNDREYFTFLKTIDSPKLFGGI